MANPWRSALIVLGTTAGLLFVPLVYFSFVLSPQIGSWLDSVLHLRVDPRFAGGADLAVFVDPVGDDHGPGSYVYPTHPDFRAGGFLDLTRYVVHEPVRGGQWTDQSDYWMLEISLARYGNPMGCPNGFSHPAIQVYIDVDGDGQGRTDTVVRGPLVRLAADHPWDFAVTADGLRARGEATSADGSWTAETTVRLNEKRETIQILVPLEHPKLRQLSAGSTTWHYVLVGALDPYAPGSFMLVKAAAKRSAGGGSDSRYAPRVFDILAPEGTTQEQLLGSYSDEERSHAVLRPVEASPGRRPRLDDRVDIEAVRKEAEELAAGRRSRDLEEAERLLRSGDSYGAARLLFAAQAHERADALLGEVLEREPAHPGALAYRGALVAMRGGESSDKSLAEAVRLVNEAIGLLDAAHDKAKGTPHEVDVALCRINVFLAIPNAVFNKAAVALDEIKELLASPPPGAGQELSPARLHGLLARAYAAAGQHALADKHAWLALDQARDASERLTALEVLAGRGARGVGGRAAPGGPRAPGRPR